MPDKDVKAALSSREWMIVEALYRLMPDKPKVVTYEDIVVKAWQMYPDVFGLRGYSDKYPDASDIHKPLYNTLKARGWVSSGPRGQKKFTLTASGWERAHAHYSSAAGAVVASGRPSRATKDEIEHLERATATALYIDGNTDEVLDTDFFDFYRTSVRAHPKDFEGRLAEVRVALKDAQRLGLASASKLSEVDAFLRERFSNVIELKTEPSKVRR